MADMTNVCTTCRFAEWDKTANGRLHPGGWGKCKWEMPHINMPIAFYFVGHPNHQLPKPNGGAINRKRLQPCPAWNLKP